MRKNKKSLICIAFLLMILSSCGNSDNSSKTKVSSFSIDENTIHLSETYTVSNWNTSNTQDNESVNNDDNNKNTGNTVEEEHYSSYEQMGELIIDNSDTSTNYKIVNNVDVEYNGRTFKNLNTVVNTVNTKYDKNTLINFIVKNYDSQSNTVYAIIELEQSDNIEDGELSLDDGIAGYQKYEDLKQEYNEKVSWRILLIDSETRSELELYGCNSYIIIPGTGDDLTIDMSEFDTNN